MTEKKEKKKKKKKKKKEFNLDKFVEREMRRAFRRCPLYSEAKRRAKEEYFIPSKTDKPIRRVHYKCAQCGKFFLDKKGQRDIAVDHIEPIHPLDRPLVSKGEMLDRMFCSVDNLQVLCNYAGERDGIRSCHKVKSANELKILAETRRRLKEQKNDNL